MYINYPGLRPGCIFLLVPPETEMLSEREASSDSSPALVSFESFSSITLRHAYEI